MLAMRMDARQRTRQRTRRTWLRHPHAGSLASRSGCMHSDRTRTALARALRAAARVTDACTRTARIRQADHALTHQRTRAAVCQRELSF